MTGFVQSKIELERDVQNELLNWKNKRHHTVLQIEDHGMLERRMRSRSLYIAIINRSSM